MNWSKRRESNPRHDLGKVGYYHYTTLATFIILADTFQKIKTYSPGLGLGFNDESW